MTSLHGIRVLDLTRVLSGPFCTRILADMGAEVVKIEKPAAGDDSRGFGPFVNRESLYFADINRNKRSVTLDLRKSEGASILKRMIPHFDVLVQNFRPGTMEKWGLSYDIVKGYNPGIIYASISGYGQTGPYRDYPAYDIIIQGMAGIMSINGSEGGEPTKLGVSIADVTAGLYSAISILGAINYRNNTGEGQFIDISLFDCIVSLLSNPISHFMASGDVPAPIGNRHMAIAPFTTLFTSDGSIILAIGNDNLWKKFCNLVDRRDLIADPRFRTNRQRCDNWKQLDPVLNEIMRTDTTETWLRVLQEKGIPCGPINDIAAVVEDPQVRARKIILDTNHPVIGDFKVMDTPIKMSSASREPYKAAPALGEHSAELLRKYAQLDDAAIAILHKNNIV